MRGDVWRSNDCEFLRIEECYEFIELRSIIYVK